MNNRILVVDDEQDFLDTVRRLLFTSGLKNVQLEKNPKKAESLFEQGETFDIALIDISMPLVNGVELLESIKKISPTTECIMITALNEAKIAVTCLKKGAYDYLLKPISKDDLIMAVNRALERKRLLNILYLDKKRPLPKFIHPNAFKPIITQSYNVLKVLKEAELHAASDVPVLITGESGTGKELLARAVHDASSRSKAPFIAVNMASNNAGLFDAEFFGHTKGAFTGAENDRAGYLEYANRGSLFLDEIGNLPLELQGKLLRVLQEKEYIKLGISKPQKVDVRIITATNADLDQLMAKNLFRKDLYYRLMGAWLHLPSVSERKNDLPLLINGFLQEFVDNEENRSIDEEAMCLLMDYDYPGNIRELRSILQSAVNLARDSPISVHFLPDYLQAARSTKRRNIQVASSPIAALSEMEKSHILKIYEETGRNKARTAKLLDIGLSTLRRKLEGYGVE